MLNLVGVSMVKLCKPISQELLKDLDWWNSQILSVSTWIHLTIFGVIILISIKYQSKPEFRRFGDSVICKAPTPQPPTLGFCEEMWGKIQVFQYPTPSPVKQKYTKTSNKSIKLMHCCYILAICLPFTALNSTTNDQVSLSNCQATGFLNAGSAIPRDPTGGTQPHWANKSRKSKQKNLWNTPSILPKLKKGSKIQRQAKWRGNYISIISRIQIV